MKTSLKTCILILTLSSATFLAQNALAAAQTSGGANSDVGMVKLLADIDGIIHSSVAVANAATYQFDNFLDRIEGSNTAGANVQYISPSLPKNMPAQKKTGLENYLAYAGNVQTSDQNLATLYQIPNQVSPAPNTADSIAQLFPNLPPAQAAPPSYSEILQGLTTDLPAVDSIYANKETLGAPGAEANTAKGGSGITEADRTLVTRPTNPDDYNNTLLNANTFLFPPNGSYQNTPGFNTSNGSVEPYSQAAAEKYVSFLSQDYIPVWNGIHFASLSTLGAQDKVLDVAKLKQSQVYMQYQLSVRNLMSARSLLMTMLNQLLAERSPVPDLGTNANLPPPYKNVHTGAASPMQLEDFHAYHRLNNPKWYSAMSTASPATVQRQTLYVLAQMLGKMQQAHIDRERALVLQAYQGFSSMQGMQRLVTADSINLNKFICHLSGVSCPKTHSPST